MTLIECEEEVEYNFLVRTRRRLHLMKQNWARTLMKQNNAKLKCIAVSRRVIDTPAL